MHPSSPWLFANSGQHDLPIFDGEATLARLEDLTPASHYVKMQQVHSFSDTFLMVNAILN